MILQRWCSRDGNIMGAVRFLGLGFRAAEILGEERSSALQMDEVTSNPMGVASMGGGEAGGQAMEEAGWAGMVTGVTPGVVQKFRATGGGQEVGGRHDGEVDVGHR